jgi:ribosome-associated translation inhibitor RaiA
MQFEVETDNHIQGREDLSEHVKSSVLASVGHYKQSLTHVQAHLGDVNGAERTGAPDKTCLLEARVTGLKNVAVSYHASTLHQAIDGAAHKLRHALDSALGKQLDRQRRGESTADVTAGVLAQDDEA